MLGSDRRYSDLKKNNPLLAKSNPARSDTILLVRLDPRQQATRCCRSRATSRT